MSLPAGLALLIVKWIYGTWDDELQTATAKPGRVMILIMLLLLSVEAFSLWIAFNKGCLRGQKSWNFDDVMLLTFVAFLTICLAGAAGTFLAFAAGWFQASKIDGSVHAIVNQMICITSSYFSVVIFCFAAVLAIFGVWMLVTPVIGLGLLGAVYLVAAVLLLQGSVSLLEKRNPNQTVRFVRSFHRAQASVDQNQRNYWIMFICERVVVSQSVDRFRHCYGQARRIAVCWCFSLLAWASTLPIPSYQRHVESMLWLEWFLSGQQSYHQPNS